MTMSLHRQLLAVLFVALVAAGCASSSESPSTTTATDTTASDAAVGDGDAPEVGAPEDGASGDRAGASDATEGVENQDGDAELDGDPTPEPLDADRNSTAREFVRLRFNIDPDVDGIDCIVAESEGNDVLDLALQTPSVAAGDVDDAQMRALTYAMNGCVDTISLADWATQAIGPQGDVRDTAPPCFVERFDDPETGDVTFYNFVALTYQFRLDAAGSDGLVDTLATCAPITSLTDFFAGQAEIATNFATVVDRGCLEEALSPPEVSEDFWGVFVSGEMAPVAFITPYTEQCASNPNAGLADAVPDDFVAWSGTGALALVAPTARNQAYDAAPPMTVDPAATYEAVVATGGGEIRVRLLVETAPIAVNNFVNLARDGFYDGTVFHRVLDGFMAQGGDPTGTGTGGPGYQFVDEFDGGPSLDRKGLLAMANTGADSNGSQFFLTFDATDWLTGNHTVFGEVVDGLDILDAIERRDPDAPTFRGQIIESVTIVES